MLEYKPSATIHSEALMNPGDGLEKRTFGALMSAMVVAHNTYLHHREKMADEWHKSQVLWWDSRIHAIESEMNVRLYLKPGQCRACLMMSPWKVAESGFGYPTIVVGPEIHADDCPTKVELYQVLNPAKGELTELQTQKGAPQ